MRYAADIRTLVFIGFYFLSVGVAWMQPLGAITLLWIAVVAAFALICIPIIHNTIHCPVFFETWQNRVFQVVLSLTFGHAVSAFVPGHNLSHHRYPNTPLDGTRVSLMRYRFNVLNQLLMFVHCIGNINRSEFKFKAEMRKRHPGWVHQYDLELVIVYAVKLSLLYMDWKRTILFVLLPHLIATWNLVNLNFWQHDGCDPDHPYNHSRNITGKLVNFFLFNNGYHGVHHMQPGLHWSLAPAYHQEHLAPFNHPNLNRPSLALYLFESCIYPGKRVMYDGRPVVLSAKEPKTEDWVARAGDAEFAFAARSFVAPERRERDRSHEMAMS